MDNYEINFPGKPTEPTEPIEPAETVDPQYASAETVSEEVETKIPVKNVSPFADSPYIMSDAALHETESYSYIPKKAKRFHFPWKPVACALLALVIVAGSCGITAVLSGQYWNGILAENQAVLDQLNNKIDNLQQQIHNNSSVGNGNSISGTPNLSVEGLTPGQVYAQNVASVVAITATTISNSGGQIHESGTRGSGFIIRQDGYVVTNHHVIEGANKIQVTTISAEVYSAKLVSYDSTNDIALLKVDAEGLPAVRLGSSEDLIVGDQVVAIGNPLGTLTSTLTVGYVSAKNREINTENSIINMIQTDTAINSGNSGGPLFNMKGEVIGITTAKYSGSSSSGASIEGIGFAIPIDDVIKKLTSLMEYGYITGAYLGVYIRNMDSSVAEMYGIPMGVYVDSVVEDFCAQKAGIQPKDLIVGLGEHKIGSINDLTRALRNFEPGDVTTVSVWRSGTYLDLEITLDAKPQQENP